MTIEKPSNAKWIKFNYDQVGYYRVNYPEAEWSKLIENYKSLSTADRTHLLEESFSIAEAGLLKYSIPLDLTKMLVDEINYIPWSVGSTMLQKIKGFLSDSVEEKFDVSSLCKIQTCLIVNNANLSDSNKIFRFRITSEMLRIKLTDS